MVRKTMHTLTETQQHRVLADELRRFVIEMFSDRNGPVEASLGELASDIDRTDPDIGAADRSRADLLIRLHHVHLPMLDDVGLIEYDRQTKQIRIVESHTVEQLANRSPAG